MNYTQCKSVNWRAWPSILWKSFYCRFGHICDSRTIMCFRDRALSLWKIINGIEYIRKNGGKLMNLLRTEAHWVSKNLTPLKNSTQKQTTQIQPDLQYYWFIFGFCVLIMWLFVLYVVQLYIESFVLYYLTLFCNSFSCCWFF